MNNITIGGTLTRDAELRFLPNGDPILNFSVADNQAGKDKPAIFWNCSLFGKRAESLAPYLLKSQQVTVSGTLTKREWEKDGVKREAIDLRVNDVLLQGGRPQGQQEQAPARQQSRPAPRPSSGGPSDFNDDVPFNSLPRRALTSL